MALKKHIGLYAVGDLAAKAMMLAHYISCSKLFERLLNERFDQDATIQKKLKIDFKNNLLGYVRWVESPGNKIPAHANVKLENSGPPQLAKAVGFYASGTTAAKAAILGYYRSYSHLLADFIEEQFERDPVIQAMLKKVHKNNLYSYLAALYPQK